MQQVQLPELTRRQVEEPPLLATSGVIELLLRDRTASHTRVAIGVRIVCVIGVDGCGVFEEIIIVSISCEIEILKIDAGGSRGTVVLHHLIFRVDLFPKGYIVLVESLLGGDAILVKGLDCDGAAFVNDLGRSDEEDEGERSEAYEVGKSICACKSGDYTSRHLCVRYSVGEKVN